MKAVINFLTFALVSRSAAGHGYFTSPLPRQYRSEGEWRSINVHTGGTIIEHINANSDIGNLNGLVGGGQGDGSPMGLCGDTIDRNIFTSPNQYGATEPRAAYEMDGVAIVQIKITAYHAGHFEFRLAVPDDGGRDMTIPITQSLLNEHVLEIHESTPRYEFVTNYAGMKGLDSYTGTGNEFKCQNTGGHVDQDAANQAPFPHGSCCNNGGSCSPPGPGLNKDRYVLEFAIEDAVYPADWQTDYTIHLKLPTGITCERCVLQWYYQTANSADAYPESFRNCVDISIFNSTAEFERPTNFPTTISTISPTDDATEQTGCVSISSQTTDEWCQSVECDPVYSDFCRYVSSTRSPTNSATTASPTTSGTTRAPTNSATTASPTTSGTTRAPTNSATTAAPTTSGTTFSPTNSANTPAPTKSDITSTIAPTPLVNDTSISAIISRELFNEMFSSRMTPQGAPCRKGLSVLTYDNFIHAANTYYPAFGRSGSYDENKREIAAFLGQISQETSGWWQGQEYTWGLCFPEEVGCESGACTQYTNYGNVQYPPIEGRTYHGRGAIQITGNENYGQASEAIFNDKSILLEDPDLLVKDGVLAFRASLWFWMTEQLPKPSCHDVMLGNAQECPAFNRFNGFGMTTNIINGGIECQVPTSQKVENRVQYFSRYTRMLGTTTGGNLYCDQMNDYNSGACPE